MDKILVPELEKELSLISLEYIYKDEVFFGNYFDSLSKVVKRNMISDSLDMHTTILESWMLNGFIPTDFEALKHIRRRDPLSAGSCFAKLGDMIAHIAKRKDGIFSIFYCPEIMQDFQKFRMRIWWEYMQKEGILCEICYSNPNTENWYINSNNVAMFLEEQGIMNDAYMKRLADIFYPKEYGKTIVKK